MYFKRVTVSSTMGPGVVVDQSSLGAVGAAAENDLMQGRPWPRHRLDPGGGAKPGPVIIEDRRRGLTMPLNGRLRRWCYPSQYLLLKVAVRSYTGECPGTGVRV